MNYNYEEVPFSILKGKIIVDVIFNETLQEIYFTTSENKIYVLKHEQECCEEVLLTDIAGDLSSLVGNQVLQAEEVSNNIDRNTKNNKKKKKPLKNVIQECYTWTFYKLSSKGGYITISWYGTSNGYYSEKACLYEVTERTYKEYYM